MKYRFEVKVSGWITKEVEAESLEEARDKAAELDMSMSLRELKWKESMVQDYLED